MGIELVQIVPASGPRVPSDGAPAEQPRPATEAPETAANPAPTSGKLKTFYIETFGCQMNVHDSEKSPGRSSRAVTGRWIILRKPTSSSTTPAASAKRLRRRSFPAWELSRRSTGTAAK